ncbi:tripartite tricarboxylate transporter TctB family protein [Paenibacillus baimaensis]|uniref:tripartite tricarboxylate transporter TctB family protein n=1 Tax=Paenibacillus baimaensis TaxID=2982185 RepID=UPI0021CE71E9|nr:tripartite tricarboxylate transporter TctB family protein [Paenibacillus sp. WQ 127069]
MKVQRYYSAAIKVVPFILGLFFFIYSSRMSFGTWNNPGPGLWPTCLSVLIMVVSVMLFFTDRNGDRKDDESFTTDSRYSLYGVLSLALFIVLFEQIGLSLPSIAVFLFWTRFLGMERWITSILVSLGLTAAIYMIFAWGLHIPFPEDQLFLLFK